jgi:hypothetical protein
LLIEFGKGGKLINLFELQSRVSTKERDTKLFKRFDLQLRIFRLLGKLDNNVSLLAEQLSSCNFGGSKKMLSIRL